MTQDRESHFLSYVLVSLAIEPKTPACVKCDSFGIIYFGASTNS
jgi:hypothetical protein